MNKKSASERLAELEIEKANLLKEIERKKNLSPEDRLAELLHEKLCEKGHSESLSWGMDSCGQYCDWENDMNGHARSLYRQTALSVFDEFKIKFR